MKQVFSKITGSFSILLICVIFSTTIKAQTKIDQKKVYIKIEVKGLGCPYCAFGMEKELKKVAGVKHVKIVLKEGLIYISTPSNQTPSKENLEKIIINGGFTVGEIEFSDTPFKFKKILQKIKNKPVNISRFQQ
ncbi:MAG: hypothetical protein JKY44_02285 [Flavobacteriaceae bacterium]|nr:hypothetical protein [Flavobacteriaceae bacterium]